ncbi:MAG: glycosyltransferase family 39 protein [gamma proteobacterium symbiont of Bathyaustriella thionipta]|nr:glycosyltransferase family 39 protein [gamma proteobacterium symbiont of Bathyaustriella thionipta]MCU7954080.1 glycosyltransferase family 39 protein [gamma proteobacterium symbiont of Bathyaustriella thionipta]MCU7956438.1 glycosyltransferase family 39 protein [gamma proteobacterium symbiont of Bathyaustriella thionipta]MCU7967704.1 glycosyltransferase family 39 protein [gamma proteobacterium symbiont of Bathyaustriella thionipta]
MNNQEIKQENQPSQIGKKIDQHPVMVALGLLLITLTLLLNGLSDFELRETTEPRVAGIAAEMFIGQDYILPKLNGQAFLEKPPLYSWLASIYYKIFDISPLSARLPSVLAACLLVLFLFWGVREITQNNRLAFTATLMLTTMVSFLGNGRQAGQDSLLTLGVAVTLLGFYIAIRKKGHNIYWMLLASGLAIASLAKGILGLSITGITVFAYLSIETIWFEKKFHIKNWFYPAIATLIGLIPLFIWLGFLYHSYGWDAVYEITWANSIGRFTGAFEGNAHEAPYYYYLSYLPEIFQPWTILVYLGLWYHFRRMHLERFSLFLCCWLIVPFILLSVSSGKRPVYLLSLYPVAAIIAASYGLYLFDQLRQGMVTMSNKIVIWLYVFLTTIGIIFQIYTIIKQPPNTLTLFIIMSLLELILLFLLWRSLFQNQQQKIPQYIIALIIIGLFNYGSLIQPYKKEKYFLKPLFETVTQKEKQNYHVALLWPDERLQGGAVFYGQHIFPEINNITDLDVFLGKSEKNLVVTEYLSDRIKHKFKIVKSFGENKHNYYIISR